MDEDEAIQLATDVVRSMAAQIEGFHSARFVSPAKVVEQWLAKGALVSQIPAGFSKRPDTWIVKFKLKEEPGERSLPETINVEVDDQTGKARIRLSM
jgi:hypothetical protein